MSENNDLKTRIADGMELIQKAWIVKERGSNVRDYDTRDEIFNLLADLSRILTALHDEVVRQSERIEELVELRSTVIDIYLDMKCSRQRDFPLKAWRETLDKFGLLENPNDDTD